MAYTAQAIIISLEPTKQTFVWRNDSSINLGMPNYTPSVGGGNDNIIFGVLGSTYFYMGMDQT